MARALHTVDRRRHVELEPARVARLLTGGVNSLLEREEDADANPGRQECDFEVSIGLLQDEARLLRAPARRGRGKLLLAARTGGGACGG